MRLHIDKRAFAAKPTATEIGGIKKRVQSGTPPTTVTIEELTEKIGSGHSISPAVMGGTSAADWQEQQLFMVDIDNEQESVSILTPKQALAICAEHGLSPTFYYPTFSYTKDKPKFRLAFVLDESITEEHKRQIIMETLILLFPQSDTACINADRIFFGTNKTVKICNENVRISFEDILRLYSPPPPPNTPTSAKGAAKETGDQELDELKRGFDLLKYMEERNGEYYPNPKGAIFRNCEICGHKDDLVYYRETNSWYCFSSSGRVGGSIIDYLMYADDLTKGQAINKLKYELCGLERPIDVWTQPIPFEEVPLPPFPVECLPDPIREFVKAVALNTETAVDMAAVCALAILASTVQGKFEIKGKEDYREQLNLFILLIARSGERKSAIVNMMTNEIYAYEERKNRSRKSEIIKQEAEINILERQIKQHERNEEYEKSRELRIKRKELEDNRPKLLRLIADDITPEAIATLLVRNNGVLTIISTEGGLFETLNGRYSNMASIDAVLKAYTGDAMRVDREGRESETINHPALSLLISAQEDVLNGVLNNEVFSGRGLTARILFCKPPSKIGTRKYETPEIPWGVKEVYNLAVRNLLDIPLPPNGSPDFLTLNENALKRTDSFFNWLEPRLADELEYTKGWAAKLVGTMLRIAGIMHCVQHQKDPFKLPVSEKTIGNAIKIAKYFLEHAKYAFSLMGADKALHGAKYIIRQLKRQPKQALTKYQIFRLCRSKHFPKTDDILPALELLIEYGYIKEQVDPTPTGGRPKGSIYILNPLYFKNEPS